MRKTLTILAASTLAVGPALAADPYAMPDDSWISISGTVVSPESDRFMLDYGDGVVTVEMDDWDDYGDASGLLEGDEVTVYGEIDDDLYEVTSIEASSVYVEDLNTYFYASSADEEEVADVDVWAVTTPIVVSQVTVRGTVTSVDELEREFTIDTENQELTVETAFLGYNPLDDAGYQKIEVGDRVSVTGVIDSDFFEGRELEADTVVTLSDNTRESAAE